ncbi:hypothetical protein J4E90_001403 [Alternaria incomplexa]|uniref:uncharacterized protein n=1 Tax=Alternaria incomplexa TaxID=1187928 RepID=UPI00221E4666|nr:uncharacterized protein J4E90_001403 [Alternaria incomplexa]KAI4922967.1 hypothetical protein J4E90_001403 [Alternaria incomplexa]
MSVKLSVRTVRHYMYFILSVIKYECRHTKYETASIQADVRNFVNNQLATDENLSTRMKTKAVAHSDDLTFIITMLYQPNYLSTFESMRLVLNLTLYMLLVVDTCDRGVFPKYKSRISTVDFAAMYRNMPERSVLVQTGISLNRSTEAPTTISDKGRLRVQEDERVKNARQTSDAVRATLRSKHGSLTAAARAGDPQWEEYQAAEAERKAMVDHVSIKIFRTEYKEHFESLGFTKAALLQLDDAITEVATTPDGVQSDADVSDLPLFVAEDEDIDAYDALLNTRNAEVTPSTEEQEKLEDLFGDSTGLDMDITDNIQSAEEIDTTLDDSRQMALHGQSLDNLRSLKKYAQSTKGHSAYNDMVEDVSAYETEGQSLPAHERIATFTREGHPKHIRGHLKSVGDSLVTCPCFPLTCTKEEEMDDLQLEAHLQITHGCLIPARIKRRSDDVTPGTAGSQRVTKKASKGTK